MLFGPKTSDFGREISIGPRISFVALGKTDDLAPSTKSVADVSITSEIIALIKDKGNNAKPPPDRQSGSLLRQTTRLQACMWIRQSARAIRCVSGFHILLFDV